jgi:CBS domain-containing protein
LAEHFVLVGLRHDRVRDIVDTVFVTLDENTLVAEAAKAMYTQERCTIVVTHLNASTGQRIPVGIITERDIIFRVVAQNRGPFKLKLKDIMSAPIITIDADKSVEEAMAILPICYIVCYRKIGVTNSSSSCNNFKCKITYD